MTDLHELVLQTEHPHALVLGATESMKGYYSFIQDDADEDADDKAAPELWKGAFCHHSD